MKLLVLSIPLILFTGCSAFRPNTQKITVTADVPNTFATINGLPCQLPRSTTVPRDQPVLIVVKREGYQEVRYTIDRKINFTGVLDIAGTCLFLFPVIGIISPGMYSLERDEVHLELAPNGQR